MYRPRPAFSLIEVLAVLSLVACLGLITVFAVRRFSPAVQGGIALRTLHSLLTLTKTQATLGNGPAGAALLIYTGQVEGRGVVAVPVAKGPLGYTPIHPPEALPRSATLCLTPAAEPLETTHAPLIHWVMPPVPSAYTGLEGNWLEVLFLPTGTLAAGPIWLALENGHGLHITLSGKITCYEISTLPQASRL